jgi:NAD(P)-dependent dehydrogenase (short-subunit alcohol dehydrogenase family)
MSLENQTALVTGASRGIGKGILEEIGNRGATVVGTATSAAGAESITENLQARGFKGCGKVLDVTDPDSVTTVVEAVQNEFGTVSILVNNAGITRDNLLMRMKEDEWEQGVPSRHDESQIWQDHHDNLSDRCYRKSGAIQLCRYQGRCCRFFQIACP